MNVKIIAMNATKMHYVKIRRVLTSVNVMLDMLVTDLLATVTMNVVETEHYVIRKLIVWTMETVIHAFVALVTKVMVMIVKILMNALIMDTNVVLSLNVSIVMVVTHASVLKGTGMVCKSVCHQNVCHLEILSYLG